MAAIEGNDDRALFQEARQAHKASRLVGQQEWRHRLSGPGRRHADAVIRKARDEAVDHVGERRAELAHCVGDRLQPDAQRRSIRRASSVAASRISANVFSVTTFSADIAFRNSAYLSPLLSASRRPRSSYRFDNRRLGRSSVLDVLLSDAEGQR